MSAETTVKVSRQRDGRFTATDTETGDSAEGATQAEALANLARKMVHLSEQADEITEAVDSIATLQHALTVIEQLATDQQASADAVAEFTQAAEFVARSRTVQQRFDDEDVTEDDVDEAIEWARSA